MSSSHLTESGPEGDPSENLVGEGAGHDEGCVSDSTSEVNKTTLGEEDDEHSASTK